MGLFGKKEARFDADAAQARMQQLRSILPAGTDVDIMEPDEDDELTYMVIVVADRAQTSALVSSVVEVVSTGEERWSLEISVNDTADESSRTPRSTSPTRPCPRSTCCSRRTTTSTPSSRARRSRSTRAMARSRSATSPEVAP